MSDGSEDAIYLQAAVWARDDETDDGDLITETTGKGVLGQLQLPYNYPNGTPVYLGDPEGGYPPDLFPNFTYTGDNSTIMYDNMLLNSSSTLLLGPLYLPQPNITIISVTVAINNNTSRTEVLGWLTIVLDARNMYDIVNSWVGLGATGEVVIIGAARPDNLFQVPPEGRSEADLETLMVQFKLPPYADRHPARVENPYLPFPMRQYPAVLQAWTHDNGGEINNAGTMWHTHNENNRSIAAGYAVVASPIVDWVVVFGQTHGEVEAPLNHLRNTVLACVFSLVAAIIVVCFPLAHYAVKPIRQLRTAAENSVTTYETYVPPSIKSDSGTEKSLLGWGGNAEKVSSREERKRKASAKRVRTFQIPEKVPETKHFIHDEMTDLTTKFNDMVEELTVQYSRLEDRVKTRTAELEKSRNEAQAANESKTLFIANVSHELRTPLNGIIGMCAVAMQEENVKRIRQSLKIIYKSSDLLLHLLNDLLTFSRSSYGQQLSIEEGTFRLVDVGNQLVSIFEKQARDADVGLKVVFLGPTSTYPNSEDDPEDAIIAKRDVAGNLRRVQTNLLARGPADIGPLREVGLRGDKNRILQILMNLVSNSLKFTPPKGQIEVRIRCKGMVDMLPPDDVSNSNTLTEHPAETPASEYPSIIVRKASEIPGQPRDVPVKGLAFDFEVEDTGPGIPEHLQQEIFKPFVQGDLTLSKKHGGTGLGLAICSQLADMMGGDIKLKSTLDIGSTFTLSLPLRYTKEKVPSVSGSLARSNRQGSVSSSVQFETFSARSGRSKQQQQPTRPRTQPHSRKQSYLSDGRVSPTLEHPRLVGFSQPFILDNDEPGSGSNSPGRRSPNPRKVDNSSRPRLESIESVDLPAVEPVLSAQKAPTTATVTESPGEITSPGAPTPFSPGDPTPGGDSAFEGPTSVSPPETPATATPKVPALRVLVAEDNAVNQQVILRLLKLEKVPDDSVTLAEDGEQALEAVRKTMADPSAPPYTLVFMDIQMPKMDGIEATKQIRALGFDAPIVALTAFDHETNRKNCDEVGMNAFLGKPIKRTALKKVMADYKPGGGQVPESKSEKKEEEKKEGQGGSAEVEKAPVA